MQSKLKPTSPFWQSDHSNLHSEERFLSGTTGVTATLPAIKATTNTHADRFLLAHGRNAVEMAQDDNRISLRYIKEVSD